MPVNSFYVSRRSFLKSVSMTAAATALPAWFLERDRAEAAPLPDLPAPNDRPHIALVGCGGQGRGDATNAFRHFGDIVAVCDVDDSHAAEAAKQFTRDGKTPEKFSDFRKLLERKDIQVVINATPDHWHTLVNMAVAQSGKDGYGEKPLTLTIEEGQQLVKAVEKHKTVFQTGTQQRSDRRFRLACELVRNGRLGKLKKITVFLPAGLREGPFKSSAVPAGLNWDFWQGQAPAFDYVKQRCHLTFRYWYEYSGGTMTDWGAHHNDIALWALGVDGPVAVEGRPLTQPIPGGYTTFSEYEVDYTYPNGVVQTTKTTTDETIFGTKTNEKGQSNGLKFEGTDGWLWVNRTEIEASDEAILKTPLPDNANRLYNSNDHMGNLFDCIRTRKAPICDAHVGHRSASICHLGAIALRTGWKLGWNAETEKFTGDHAEEANAWIGRVMRKPYDYSFIS